MRKPLESGCFRRADEPIYIKTSDINELVFTFSSRSLDVHILKAVKQGVRQIRS